MRRVLALLVACLAGALLGCAPNVEFNKAAAASIQSIAITGCQHPMDYFVLDVRITKDPDYKQRLDTELHRQRFDLGDDLTRAIARALVAEGYEIKGAPTEADASLECTSSVALYDGGTFGIAFVPSMQLDIALVEHRTGQTIFAKRFFYGGSSSISPMGVTAIPSDPKYIFASDDALVADPERAKDGLRAGASLIAESLANMLAKRP